MNSPKLYEYIYQERVNFLSYTLYESFKKNNTYRYLYRKCYFGDDFKTPYRKKIIYY